MVLSASRARADARVSDESTARLFFALLVHVARSFGCDRPFFHRSTESDRLSKCFRSEPDLLETIRHGSSAASLHSLLFDFTYRFKLNVILLLDMTMEKESRYAKLNKKANIFVVRMPEEMRKKLDRMQFKSKLSLNKIIIAALAEYLSKQK